MKAVILAGGFGTRISEESAVIPKPMIQIGGKPILWHILKIYSSHGINDFVICLGYKGYVIKEYFANYFLHTSDITFDMRDNQMHVHQKYAEPWKITLVDTGEATNTGGRLKRVSSYLEPNEPFCFTYGDGVANIDISSEIDFHRSHGKLVTVCAVQPPGRYGALIMDKTQVLGFQEKPPGDGGWINGGYFVVDPNALKYICDDLSSWESDAVKQIAADGQLQAFEHHGFWQPMDTLRDKIQLEDYWNKNKAPWKVWT